MQLNEILEAYSIRDIGKKTNISEDNLKNLFDMNFTSLTKVKTMGFISILQREYNADLIDFKNIADDYYNQNREVFQYALSGSIEEEKSSNNSKIFIFVIILIFGYASFYFFTQFDKKHLSTWNPFTQDDDLTIETNISKKLDKNISEEEDNRQKPKVDSIKVLEDTQKIDISTILDTPLVDINISVKDLKKESVKKVVEIAKIKEAEPKKEESKKIEKKIVIIEPSRRLWFGIRDIKTKKRDQFSIAKAYKLDVTNQDWLLATSPASFYLIVDGNKTYYRGGKAQYLKVTKDGIEKLTKKEYVRKGGWRQW